MSSDSLDKEIEAALDGVDLQALDSREEAPSSAGSDRLYPGSVVGVHGDDVIIRRDGRNRRPLTSEALVRAYQKEADRQKLLIKKAELTQGRLLFICQAFRTLLEDDHFVTLLRAEGLETMPSSLQDSLAEGAAP